MQRVKRETSTLFLLLAFCGLSMFSLPPQLVMGPPFLYKFTHSSFLCLYGWSQWVLFFATEESQGWSGSQTHLWWSATFSMWHLFSRAEPMLPGLDAGSGTTSIVWASHPWFICHQCLNTHVLLLCFQSLHQTKIDSVIDSSLSGAWLSIWGRNLKSLTGSQRVGVTPGFLLLIPLAGLSSFFPPKGVNLTFRLVIKVAIFSYLWRRHKGLCGRTAHRILFEERQMVLQDPAGSAVSCTVPEMCTVILIAL